MIERWRGQPRRRIRNVAIVVASLLAVLLAGIGTANAGDRGWFGKKHRPGPAASASRTANPTQSARPPRSSQQPSQTASAPAKTPGATPSGAKGIVLPPVNTGFDYQIGGSYAVPSGVGTVSRDRGAAPAAGVYNICYVNGFHAQPEELSTWKKNHDDLLLKRGSSYVVDGDWNEVLLDISTQAKRDALTAIVGAWIDGCAAKGFQAVEIDNLDSWTRSQNLLTRSHAVAYAKQLTQVAHGRGLAVGQKNTVEIASVARTQVGFDFAVTESCADYELTNGVPECQGFVDAYGTHVLVIEYDSGHFQQACTRYGNALSIVQRDQDVTTPGSSTYVFKSC